MVYDGPRLRRDGNRWNRRRGSGHTAPIGAALAQYMPQHNISRIQEYNKQKKSTCMYHNTLAKNVNRHSVLLKKGKGAGLLSDIQCFIRLLHFYPLVTEPVHS